jgi:uncharacterized protein
MKTLKTLTSNSPYVDQLTHHVCRSLLQSHRLGRVAFINDEGLPTIFPVNYRLNGDEVVIRTDHGELYNGSAAHQVAFEVDDYDDATRTGWSVLVRGFARDVTESDDLLYEMAVFDEPFPWAPGERNAILAIPIDRISGRQIVRHRLGASS